MTLSSTFLSSKLLTMFLTLSLGLPLAGMAIGVRREVEDDSDAVEDVLDPRGWMSGKRALMADDRWVSGGSSAG
jgi:hypothetical protein